jgi:MFS transporter, DHA1 family, multidrug resistance protein
MLVGRATRNITLHYLLTNLGYFGLMSTLAVSLTAARFNAAQTGFLVLVFTITSKAGKVPLARWLDKLPPAAGVLIGCLAAAAGFAALRIVNGIALTAAALMLAGLGVSVNGLASKQLAASASDQAGSRARLFSLVNIAVNISSATAAPVALFFVNRHHYDYAMTGVAAIYCITGVTTYLNYSGLRRKPGNRGERSQRSSYRTVFWLPGMRPYLLINFLGWLCYGQLFNALAIYVSSTLKDEGTLGWLYTLNALIIVAAQLAVTRQLGRWHKERQTVIAVTAYTTFALSFLMVYLVPGYPGAVLGVIVFTFAEMMFVPTMDVFLLSLLGDHSRAVGYGLFSIGDALGEGVGGGVGVAVYRWLADSGHGSDFWLITTVMAAAAAMLAYGLGAISPALHPPASGEQLARSAR